MGQPLLLIGQLIYTIEHSWEERRLRYQMARSLRKIRSETNFWSEYAIFNFSCATSKYLFTSTRSLCKVSLAKHHYCSSQLFLVLCCNRVRKPIWRYVSVLQIFRAFLPTRFKVLQRLVSLTNIIVRDDSQTSNHHFKTKKYPILQ